MRKIVLYVLTVVFAAPVYGQDRLTAQLDKQLKDHPQADTGRVNRLNQLGDYISIQPGKRDTVSAEALSISQKIHYDSGELYALINRAFVLNEQGHKDQAAKLLEQSLALAKKVNDEGLWVRYWIVMARANSQIDNKRALLFYFKADSLAENLKDKALTARVQRLIGNFYATSLSDYPKAMDWALKAVKNAEEANSLNDLVLSWISIATYHTIMGEQKSSLIYYQKALEANKQLGNTTILNSLYNGIGERYRLMGNYSEALKAYNQQRALVKTPYLIELVESNMADVYVRMGNLPYAFKYAFHSLELATGINDSEGIAWIDGILGRAYIKLNKPDSAVYYGNKGLEAAKKTGTIEFIRDNYAVLSNAYALQKNFANAYKYQGLYVAARDSMLNTEITNKASLLQYNYDLAKKQAQISALSQEKKMQYYFLAGSLGILLIIGTTGVILFKNNRQKQKANELLSKQKQIIEEQRDETNKALNELKLTQNQLVQSAKMASLGELTAGIAHEIQNPLNFVNNFSDVNREMIGELKGELKNGNVNEALAIADDIEQNEVKINHHGKRADFIVKGMLEHSRTSTGERQVTNINLLADEFLKLSYHGLRAKDKNFNADLATHFDPNLPKVNVVQQDIGRVLINLFSNAFYAVNQKSKTAGADYKPTVEVTTAKENGSILIKVKDNGSGIPDAIRDKIMQPFFTTKPAGEGTGLGLSLSYDIIVKGHGGSINVDTKEGEFTEFIVSLPL